MNTKILYLLLLSVLSVNFSTVNDEVKLEKNIIQNNIVSNNSELDSSINDVEIQVKVNIENDNDENKNTIEINEGIGNFIEIEFPTFGDSETSESEESINDNEIITDNCGDIMPGEGFGPLV